MSSVSDDIALRVTNEYHLTLEIQKYDSKYVKERQELSRDHGFCSIKSAFNSEMRFQKRFKRNIFKILMDAKEHPDHTLIHKNVSTAILERFNQYMLRINSFGLRAKWESDSEVKNLSQKLLKHDDPEISEISTEDFVFIMTFYIECIGISFICFVMEILIFRIMFYLNLN